MKECRVEVKNSIGIAVSIALHVNDQELTDHSFMTDADDGDIAMVVSDWAHVYQLPEEEEQRLHQAIKEKLAAEAKQTATQT